MSYNLSVFNGGNTTNLLQAANAVNNASGYWLGSLMLFAVWVFFFMTFKKEDDIKDLYVSFFLTSIVAVLMLSVNLIMWQVMMIPIVCFIGFFMVSFFL